MTTIVGTDGDTTAQIPSGAILSAVPQPIYVSPLINLLTTTTGGILTPTGPWPRGKYFVIIGTRFVLEQLDGTITTGFTFNVGNDASKINMQASSAITNTTLNNANTAGMPTMVSSLATNGLTRQLLDPSVSLPKYDVTVAAVANTATVCKGRIYVLGFITS